MIFRITTARPTDSEGLLPLISQYQLFYGAQPDAARNHAFFAPYWSDDNPLGAQFIARGEESDSAALGFATVYFLPSSTGARTFALLNDLFCLPSLRGQGLGRALVLHARAYAGARGYQGLEWQTQVENLTAQRLYDSLGAQRTAWYTYSLR